ncbi:hypothetical protein DFJ74DRAFT_26416 [Hyaloraphidium curvatum]|nr:hypothetical protein DFJ74DRAFT_26416 [Hyaloraphidium curvatum]
MASDSVPDAPPRPVGFTPQELTFLFPSWPRIPPSLSGAPGPADTAADFRKAYAVTPKRLLDALIPFPATRTVARVSLSLGPHTVHNDALSAAAVLALVPLCTAVFLFNDGQFGHSQLVAGTAAVLWNWTCSALFFVATKAISRYWYTMGRARPDDGLNSVPWAVIVRWLELVGNGRLGGGVQECPDERGKPASNTAREPQLSCANLQTLSQNAESGCIPPQGMVRLLDHDPSRPELCPCPLPRCAGGLVTRSAWHALLRTVVVGLPQLVTILGSLWTPMVTFAGRTWTTWWTALPACVVIVCGLLYVFFGSMMQLQLWNPGLLELLLRGHHRAVSLSLSSFLETARRSLESGHPLRPDADEQHVGLHQILMRVWQNRLDDGKGVLAFFVWSTLGNVVLCSVITASTGSCITMWTLGALGISLAYQAFELASFAVSNAQVDAVGLLYAQARDELGLLLARSPRAAPGIREDLGYHEKVLAVQAEVGRYKARFLGFAVGYSVLRTLLATLFTLGVGLWSILRSAGVFATVETFCPIR